MRRDGVRRGEPITQYNEGDLVIDISTFRTNGKAAIITSVAPDGALFGHFDDGSIMWRYTSDMVVPAVPYWQDWHACTLTDGCTGIMRHTLEVMRSDDKPEYRVYECNTCHATEIEYVVKRDAIVCPNCHAQQVGTVTQRDGDPWASYVHWCTECDYLIMESEWTPVEMETGAEPEPDRWSMGVSE